MDQIEMNSFFQRRIGKAKDQMDELENEVKLLHLRTKFISEKGLTLVRNINSLDELRSLEEYTSVYGYLSKYTKVLSEFNCNLEILLFTDGFMNELNNMDSLEYSLEKGIKEKENFNLDYFNDEIHLKELRVCTNLPSTKYVSSKEKISESVTSLKPNERQEEEKTLTDFEKNEEENESSNVKTEITNSEEVEKNLTQESQNLTDNTCKIAEFLSNEKKNVSALNSVELTGYPIQKASNFHSYNFNSGSSIMKPKSTTMINQFNNLPPFMNGSASSDNNYLHCYSSNGFPTENNYWQITQEMKKQCQNIPFNSGAIRQYQAEQCSFNGSNRQNFYFPSIPPQQNFNFWNNEYHYSNIQTLNPTPKQIVNSSSMQYIYPYRANIQSIRNHRYDFPENYIRWPEPPNAFNAIQEAQCPPGISNFSLPVIANETQSSQQTSQVKKIKSNSTNPNNEKTDKNPTKDSVPENKELLDENSEKELNPKCEYIRLLNFNREIGLKYKVKISYLVSPNEFYVHVNCEELALMKVMNKHLKRLDSIKEAEEPQGILSNYRSSKVDFSKNFGCYALGYCVENSSWNRLKILDWRLGSKDEMVSVFLIDRGNIVNLPFSMMKPMDSVYMNYPQFSQKCYLSGISNAGMSSDLAPVSSDEVKAMFEVLVEPVQKDYNLTIEIVEVDDFEKNESLGVRLFLSELDICVNDKLKKFKIITPASSGKNDDYSCYGDSSKDESALDLGTFLPLFSIGEKISVKVTCILRVNRFFCVKDYKEMNETDVLMKLARSLNDRKRTSLNVPPKTGELILGKYTDLLYYRAKVIRSEPDCDHYKVLFLDYGNTEQLSLKDMKKLEKKDLKIPFQMIECYLDCVELSSEIHEPLEAVNYLTKKIEEGFVTIEIKRILDSKRGIYDVDIYDRHGNNIACELISERYCVSLKKN